MSRRFLVKFIYALTSVIMWSGIVYIASIYGWKTALGLSFFGAISFLSGVLWVHLESLIVSDRAEGYFFEVREELREMRNDITEIYTKFIYNKRNTKRNRK